MSQSFIAKIGTGTREASRRERQLGPGTGIKEDSVHDALVELLEDEDRIRRIIDSRGPTKRGPYRKRPR